MAGRRAGAGLALAAIALSAAGCGLGGSTKTTTVTRTVTRTVTTTRTVTQPSTSTACTGSQLSGTFAVQQGSEGAGQIAYTLTLTNTSSSACSLASPPNAVLLDSNGSALPTHVTPVYGTGPTVTLASDASAKAIARFSPDVPGSGDSQSGACQPKAHKLQVMPSGGGTVDVPITPPTSVCERGALQFEPFSTG